MLHGLISPLAVVISGLLQLQREHSLLTVIPYPLKRGNDAALLTQLSFSSCTAITGMVRIAI